MKLITRNTDYALRALCYLSKHKNLISVEELVKKLGVPRPFMRKILQQLSKKRIMESFKGQKGGFRLKLPPEKIYIMAIMRIFQGRLELNECFLKKNVCPNKGKCALSKKLRLIEKSVFKQLKEITIASLIGTRKSPALKPGMNAQRLSAEVSVADHLEKKPRALARGDSF